jgi:flagellar hook-associated protein 3 FlgL
MSVTRISTNASNQVLINRMIDLQQRVQTSQVQLSSGFKSQDYLGIAGDSFQLLNIENEKARLQRYISNNSLTTTTLKAQQTSAQGIDDVARMIRSALLEFQGRDLSAQNPENKAAVADLQGKVYNAFSSVQYFLSQKIDGKYIFGGAQSDKPPFSLPYNSLQDFQNFYDGNTAVFPSSRVANLVDITFNDIDVTYATPSAPLDTTTQVTAANPDAFITNTIDQTATGNLIFSNVADQGKITAATPASFKSLQIGQTILVNGSTNSNNGVYTITSVSPDGNSITLDQPFNNPAVEPEANNVQVKLAVPNGTALALTGSTAGNNGAYTVTWPTNAQLIAAGLDPNGGAIVTGDVIFTKAPIPVTTDPETITLDSRAFITGTNLGTTQRLSDTQSITMDVTGLDPAFEKVVRAFGILAQGDLINHPDRVTQALAVLNDAIEHSSLQPTEEKSDLQSVQDRIAINIKALTDAKNVQTQFMAFLEGRQNEIEQVDKTETAVRLQTDAQTLEISYASISKITSLSLLNYL